MTSYLIPTVIESTPRGDRATDIYSRLLSERIVFIGSAIDDGVANVVVAQLLHLAAENAQRDINLYINSPGGSFTAMLAIYDTMRFVAPDVATICVGQAAASAAILLAAGANGKRAVLEHARVLLHQPHSETGDSDRRSATTFDRRSLDSRSTARSSRRGSLRSIARQYSDPAQLQIGPVRVGHCSGQERDRAAPGLDDGRWVPAGPLMCGPAGRRRPQSSRRARRPTEGASLTSHGNRRALPT